MRPEGGGLRINRTTENLSQAATFGREGEACGPPL